MSLISMPTTNRFPFASRRRKAVGPGRRRSWIRGRGRRWTNRRAPAGEHVAGAARSLVFLRYAQQKDLGADAGTVAGLSSEVVM